MKADLFEQYEAQAQVEYQGERYLVRDNGAVWRMARPRRRARKHDEAWTFGRPDNSDGYMHVGSHVVHRIVAIAFHGACPSEKHIVDHIDTNRRNNRADNLRWVTRLDNVLRNPITRKKIEIAYGSLEAFFENPGAPREQVPNFDWMRTVTKEEAEESRERLRRWAASDRTPSGGQLGEWVYGSRQSSEAVLAAARDKPSLTPMAIQRGWRTPSEFPACPASLGSDPLGEYLSCLKFGTVFSRNTFGASSTVAAEQGNGLVTVLCSLPAGSVKAWALSKVTVENEKFVHESLGTYFTLQGAVKAHCRQLNVSFEDSIDDYS